MTSDSSHPGDNVQNNALGEVSIPIGALTDIGLTEKESKVYFHLLSIGNATPRVIADELNLSRSTVYEVLESLSGKGYAIRPESSDATEYVAARPDVLLQHVDAHLERYESAERTLAELSTEIESLHPKYSSEPGINFFDEGSEGNVYRDILATGEQEIYCVLSSSERSEQVARHTKEFYSNLKKHNANMTGLMERGSSTPELAVIQGKRLEVLKSPFDIDTDIFIYGEKIALLSYGESFGAIIKTPDIASAMRELVLLAMKEVEYE